MQHPACGLSSVGDVMGPPLSGRGGVPILVASLDGGTPMFMFKKKLKMPTPADALPGRTQPIPTAAKHFINGRALKGPYPDGLETAIFGLGCFWGAERKFWELG